MKLLPPCLECVRDVHKQLQRTVEDCIDSDIASRFPRLIEHFVGAVNKFLSERLTKVNDTLKYHIAIESGFVSTSRQDFRDKLVELMEGKDITDISFAQSVLLNKYNVANDSVEQETVHSDAESSGFEKIIETTETLMASANYNGTGVVNKAVNSKLKNLSGNTNMGDRYIVRCLIEAYFEIVRQSVRDYVPKLLTHSMIYFTCDNLQVFLVSE